MSMQLSSIDDPIINLPSGLHLCKSIGLESKLIVIRISCVAEQDPMGLSGVYTWASAGEEAGVVNPPPPNMIGVKLYQTIT